MKKGDKYRFKHTSESCPEELTYIGHNWSGNGYWHQFTKVGESKVWCELSRGDLRLIEPVT
jgi:hypothetical protein